MMIPPGTWKFFFTTGLADFLVSTKHTKIDTVPFTVKIIFDKRNPQTTTNEFTINQLNKI